MWTDERVELMRRLWLEGHSASQIAKQLGGVTRNAVIGKVHRLGLSGRAAPSQPVRAAFRAPRPPRPAIAHAPPARRPAEVRSPTTAVVATRPPIRTDERGTATVLTLAAHMCKWPIGDPATADFSFCGRRAGPEGPYCADHARLAYQPQQLKKKSSAAELARSLRRYI